MSKETGTKETGKKAKAPAKAKTAGKMPEGEGKVKAAPKAAAKAESKTRAKTAETIEVVEVAVVRAPSYEEIARLAEHYWAERGWQNGYAEQDWLRAERELLQRAS